jgi:hypothetical protein
VPHQDQTPQQAIDALAAAARELSAAYANLSTHVKGDEAQRVCRVLEFEVDVMNASISILRKAFGDQRVAERVSGRTEPVEVAS